MTALPLIRPDLSAPVPTRDPHADEPVALLQLDVSDPAEAASAVYREVRRGRRVVALACGAAGAAGQLARSLDAIGVIASRPAPGEVVLGAGVTILPGPEAVPVRPRPAADRVLRIGLAGCGVVGGGVLTRLLADPRFEVVGVLVRDANRVRETSIPCGLTVSDPAALLAREPDILIEAISDASTGLALIRAALARGIDVISANKQAVGSDLAALLALAAANDARLLYSASVGGGAPLIETVRRARDHGAIVRIEAVLNGTCNFILNRLAEGRPFAEALAAAGAAGFAEADPSADLTGLDAAAKLAILACEGLSEGVAVADVARDTLAPDPALPAGRVRQVARLDVRTGEAAVGLCAVDADLLFADLADEWNALRVTTADGRTFTARGRGAGRVPTTESVWADLTDLARDPA